ncbi:hypothetical protein LXA43DRAFT_1068843 [Ganoderma leucocontextum]|nr:hypothetical protein LXA43DRAFT_1068843 [Ganoderma leucocontextum]
MSDSSTVVFRPVKVAIWTSPITAKPLKSSLGVICVSSGSESEPEPIAPKKSHTSQPQLQSRPMSQFSKVLPKPRQKRTREPETSDVAPAPVKGKGKEIVMPGRSSSPGSSVNPPNKRARVDDSTHAETSAELQPASCPTIPYGRSGVASDGRSGVLSDGRSGVLSDGCSGVASDGRSGVLSDGRSGVASDGRLNLADDRLGVPSLLEDPWHIPSNDRLNGGNPHALVYTYPLPQHGVTSNPQTGIPVPLPGYNTYLTTNYYPFANTYDPARQPPPNINFPAAHPPGTSGMPQLLTTQNIAGMSQKPSVFWTPP